MQAFCAWKTAQDGQLVRYRVITEAEHQLIRSSRDRMDAYLLGDSNSAGAAAAGVVSVNAGGAVVPAKPAQGKAAGGKQAVNITVTVGGVGAAAAAAAGGRADNVDMVMMVSGQDAVKVCVEVWGLGFLVVHRSSRRCGCVLCFWLWGKSALAVRRTTVGSTGRL